MDAARLTGFERVRRFAGELELSRIPPEVRHFASLLLLDTIGVAAAARELEAARICRELAVASFSAGPGAPSVRPQPRRSKEITRKPAFVKAGIWCSQARTLPVAACISTTGTPVPPVSM